MDQKDLDREFLLQPSALFNHTDIEEITVPL